MAEAELDEAQRREWCWPAGQGWGGSRTWPGAPGPRLAWSSLTATRSHCPSDRLCTGLLPVLARVQEQLTSRWEGNQALAARTRDQLAQHEAGLMDLREALNRAVDTTREAQELNSRNLERLEEALHRKQELSRDNATLRDTLQAARDTLARVSELLHGMDRAKEVSTALPGCTPGGVGCNCPQNVAPGVPGEGSEQGVGTRVPPSPSTPRSMSTWLPAWTGPGHRCWRRFEPSPPRVARWTWWRLLRPTRGSWTSWHTTSPGAGVPLGHSRVPARGVKASRGQLVWQVQKPVPSREAGPHRQAGRAAGMVGDHVPA